MDEQQTTRAEARFLAKVEQGGCWVWTAARNKDGYGSFWSGEYRDGDYRNGPIMVLAHRWSYEHFIGPVPDGHGVLHHCDNPPCVNPAHLFTGTQEDNVHDSLAKGRFNREGSRPKRPARYCSVEGCNGLHNSLGLCLKHYTRRRREDEDFKR